MQRLRVTGTQPPRPKKPEPELLVILRENLDALDRPTLEAMDLKKQLMLTMRMLYENPERIVLLGGSREHGSGLMVTAIDYIVDRDPAFAKVRETSASRAKFGALFLRLVQSNERQFNTNAARIAYFFGEEVSAITQNMAEASSKWLSAQYLQMMLAGETPEPRRQTLTRMFRRDHALSEPFEDVIKTLPADFCEQWHKRHKMLAHSHGY